MKRRTRNFFAIAILTLALVLCFTVTALADDINPLQSTGIWLTGQLEPNERASYDMTLAKSGTVSYEFTCTEECAGIIIAPKDGSRPGMMSDTYIHEGETVEKTRELNAGEYTVTIINDSTSRKSSSYGYRIDVTYSKETYSMDNNEIAHASGTLSFDKEIIGHHAFNDDFDIYRVVLNKSGRVNARVIPSPATTGIIVMDGQGNTIPTYVSETEDSEGFTYGIDLAPGTYYFKFTKGSIGKYQVVHQYEYTDVGEYKFTLSFQNAKEKYTYSNNSIAEVMDKTAVPLDKTIKGQLASNDEYDYYKLIIPKTGDYRITINEDSNFFSHGHPFSFNSLMKDDGTIIRADLENTDNANPPQVTYYYRGLKKGTYYMQFFEDEYYSKKTGPYSFIAKPAPVSIYTPDAGKKSFTARWEKGTGNGYQIQYALNKKMTKSKKTVFTTAKPKKGSTTVTKTFNKLKAKKTYYVRIRSYVNYKVNGKTKKAYSDWSDIQKVKTKK